MVRNRVPLSPFFGAAVFAVALATPALACPPSISIERPARPPSAGSANAFVLVHALPGCHPGSLAVSGTAEGLVGGERRSIALDVAPTATPDLYVVRRQWPAGGVWVLRLTVTAGGGHATALVGTGASGDVARVREPTRDGGAIRDPGDADVAAMLRALTAG